MNAPVSAAFAIAPAAEGDLPAIMQLLREADMPGEDLPGRPVRFLVARDSRQRVVGAVGAEVHGTDALLRSFVVAAEHRRAGLGRRLVDALEQAAVGWGVRRWWLLTVSAEAFFAARGFRRAPRGTAPAAIQRTTLFATHCPSLAVCMTRAVGSA